MKKVSGRVGRECKISIITPRPRPALAQNCTNSVSQAPPPNPFPKSLDPAIKSIICSCSPSAPLPPLLVYKLFFPPLNLNPQHGIFQTLFFTALFSTVILFTVLTLISVMIGFIFKHPVFCLFVPVKRHIPILQNFKRKQNIMYTPYRGS